MFLPLINQFTTRIPLKGGVVLVPLLLTLRAVNYYHKELHLGCCSSPRSASALAQIRKRYLTYFKHKHPIKNETKTKKRNCRLLYFTSLTLKSTPGKYFMKS